MSKVRLCQGYICHEVYHYNLTAFYYFISFNNYGDLLKLLK